VKTKALIREKIWFPGIDSMVVNMVKSCHACQVVTYKPKLEPLLMWPLPTGPWRELSADFGEIHSGKYLLVITDDYSRFPVVEIITSTSANKVIPIVDKIFSEYGIPDILHTDNGLPFNSRNFAEFALSVGFKHRKNYSAMA
jgi:transposase InsO family protein